jgi:hypothetical protein
MVAACGGSDSSAPGASNPSTSNPTASSSASPAIPSSTHDASNELPIGWMDQPMAGLDTSGKFVVSGWAVDNSSVKEVRIYVDSHFKTSTKLTVPRGDLQGPFAAYMHGTDIHGWRVDLDLSEAPGKHIIQAKVEDDQGETRDLNSAVINIQP